MRYRRRWIVALVLVALVVPQIAFAKAPTERITIGGEALAVARDGEEVPFNPWGGEFLAWDGEFLGDEPPADLAGREPHAVRFWADLEGNGDASIIYGFEYYPGEPGSIRLAERGEELWELNQGTIARPTGWYYASPEWEAFVDAQLPDESSSTAARWLVVPALAVGAVVTAGFGFAVTRRRAS